MQQSVVDKVVFLYRLLIHKLWRIVVQWNQQAWFLQITYILHHRRRAAGHTCWLYKIAQPVKGARLHHAFCQSANAHAQGVFILHLVAHYQIIEEYPVVKAVEPHPLFSEVDELGKASPFEISAEMALQFIRFSSVLGTSGYWNPNGFQIFFERIGEHIDWQISASKYGFNITTEHFSVAASHIHPVFLVCKAACKVCPSIHILYLVEKEYGLTAVHTVVSL